MQNIKTVIGFPYLQVAEVPLDSVPREVVELATAFFRKFRWATLSNFARTLVDAVFNDIPDSASTATQEVNVSSASCCSPTTMI